ncbi:nucleolar protein dao-5-like [Saccostrea echinata]|uniref:nucleolar protein dao-5-like n=1 Tax=Saccostrea echinata TaxID=191078 RepID=UPI002A824F96|nr:nucleolar protein dao-5-like [Saccostrea echinata]
MARTKASVIDQDNPRVKLSGKSKPNQQKKRKDKAQSNDSVKKKKIKKEESESEDSDEQSKFPQFYKGTTWPLDAKVEVHVDYEEVKEVRKIKPPFLPLLYQLTRGEPESITKAVTSIQPVHQLLKERFVKEDKPEVKQEPDKKPLAVNPKKVDLATLKKIPSQHFRDAKGKWLPKKKWKFAEILKNKPKLRHLLSERTEKSDGNRVTDNTDKGQQGTAKKLTLLADARSAIEEVLARVCMRRQEFAKLIVWLRSLEMKSYGKSNTPNSVRPWRKKIRSSPRSKPKAIPKTAVRETEADASSDDDTNVPIKKAMYGLEKSSIIRNTRLRNKPKYMPYIPPKNRESKEPAKVTSKTKKENRVSGQHSGSAKSLPQQSESSKSLTQQTGSSRGFSVLFKGRTFSSGKKFFFNRRQNVQSESDSEDNEEENDRSSTNTRKSKENRQSKSGLESTDNQNPGKEKSKSQQKIKKATPSTSRLQESSPSSGTEGESEEEDAVEKRRTLKSSSALFPQVRVPLMKLSDAVKPSSQKEEGPLNIVPSADCRQTEAKHGDPQASQNNSEGRTSCSGNVSKLKRTINKEGNELSDKPVRKKAKIQMVMWKDDVEKLKDNVNKNGGLEEDEDMTGMQNEAEMGEGSTPTSPLLGEEDGSSEEFPPPEVHIENLEGEDMRTNDEDNNAGDMEAYEGEEGDISSASLILENTVTQSSGEERENDSSNAERGNNSSNIERGNNSMNLERGNNSSITERENTCSSSYVEIGDNSSSIERGTNSSIIEKVNNSTNLEKGNKSSTAERGNSSSNVEKGDNSSNAERPSGSSSNPQKSSTEETLRLLISHLSNLRDSQGEAVDCKILFSNANQVLTISGRKNISLEESIDVKPIIDQGESLGNSGAPTSDRVNRASPDTSNQMDNPESSELNVRGIVENVESDDSSLEIISPETMTTVKQESVETEGEEVELKNQKEAEAIIIIDD